MNAQSLSDTVTKASSELTSSPAVVKEEPEEEEWDEGTLDPTHNAKYYTSKKTGRATWTEPSLKKVVETVRKDEGEDEEKVKVRERAYGIHSRYFRSYGAERSEVTS